MEGKKTVTIGIMGAGPGCGVTHFTLLFANYLAAVELKRTAVLEWNKSHALKELCRVCTGQEAAPKGDGKRPVPILEVDHFPEGGAEELAWCQKEGYDFILLDLGHVQDGDRAVFLQCGWRFFLGALNEWKLKELLDWKEWILSGKGHWTFLAVFGSKEARKEIKRRFGISFGAVPYAPDVFLIERETAVFFKELRRGKG